MQLLVQHNLYSVSQHGTGATFIAWSNDGLGAIKGLEVTNFGTGYTSSPTVIVPTKMLVTRRTGSTPPDVSLSSSFTVGDTITGQQSSATAEVISWDNTRQLLTLKILTGTFILGELIDRGSITNYAIVSRQNTRPYCINRNTRNYAVHLKTIKVKSVNLL